MLADFLLALLGMSTNASVLALLFYELRRAGAKRQFDDLVTEALHGYLG